LLKFNNFFLLTSRGFFILQKQIYTTSQALKPIKKLADALEVCLDYLVGEGDLKILDKKTIKRLEDIENLPDEDRANIFYTIDNLFKAAKLKAI